MTFQKIETGNLQDRIQSLMDNLDHFPETLGDDPCPTCYGFGQVKQSSEITPCPVCYRQSFIRSVDNLHRNHWEGWGLNLADIRLLKNFQETQSYIHANDLYGLIEVGEDPTGLILCGGHGRGKTLSSLAAVRSCAEICEPAYAFRFTWLVNQYRRGTEGNENIDRLYERIEQCKLVVVDEYGREDGRGNLDIPQQALYEIVSRCYRQRFLIMTSNLPRSELGRQMSSDIVSRLSSKNGYCTIVEEPYDQDLRCMEL